MIRQGSKHTFFFITENIWHGCKEGRPLSYVSVKGQDDKLMVYTCAESNLDLAAFCTVEAKPQFPSARTAHYLLLDDSCRWPGPSELSSQEDMHAQILKLRGILVSINSIPKCVHSHTSIAELNAKSSYC